MVEIGCGTNEVLMSSEIFNIGDNGGENFSKVFFGDLGLDFINPPQISFHCQMICRTSCEVHERLLSLYKFDLRSWMMVFMLFQMFQCCRIGSSVHGIIGSYSNLALDNGVSSTSTSILSNDGTIQSMYLVKFYGKILLY